MKEPLIGPKPPSGSRSAGWEGPPVLGSSSEFWERIYEARTRPSNGVPNSFMVEVALGLEPGRALDLGCALGDDANWLAVRGWQVTGVDVSATALEWAEAGARRLGVADRLAFERHDLAESFPGGEFDFVYALYLQSPIEFGREQALRHAVRAVAPGGRLLLVVHGSRLPWGWDKNPDVHFPTPEEQLDALGLPDGWQVEVNDTRERQARGPNGQVATVVDVVTLVRRPLRGHDDGSPTRGPAMATRAVGRHQ